MDGRDGRAEALNGLEASDVTAEAAVWLCDPGMRDASCAVRRDKV